ncbi:ATP-binding cassette domain-containing protein [Streptococcus entericus]|uniref:ATP-binding cassette domain-containing protein n=1 Tax=Streptococcus entericus TaxID=155680 RepID=UPI00035DD7D7|nr:ATP-binding cassette domain-containing protein [Streptococcus entericus]
MLQLKDVTITHKKDLQVIVENLSLVVNPGDKLAIIGEEGTGKSTLIQAMLASHLIESYADVTGHITSHFNRIGYLPQRLPEQLLNQTVTDFIYADMAIEQFDFALFWKYVERFDLPIERFEEKQQSLSSLSGGEKIKLQLLKILVGNPDLLVLDEPSGDLDLATLIWLEDFIRQTDKTVIFISHDEELLARAASRILHLELVKKRREARWTLYKGTYDNYKKERSEALTKQLQVATKQRDEAAKRLMKHQQLQQRVEHQLRQTKNDVAGRLLAKKMKSLKSQTKRFDRESQEFIDFPEDTDSINLFFSDVTPLPKQKNLLFWEHKPLLTGQRLSLSLRGQDRLAIIGKNGVGKTRLLMTIRDELIEREHLSVGYMPQDYHQILPEQTSALEVLTERVSEEAARSLLASLQFTRQEIQHAVGELSGGQKAKLCLAKMVLEKNQIILLDEPTRHLSPTSQEEFRRLIQAYPGAIIVVTHDRALLNALDWQLLDLEHH